MGLACCGTSCLRRCFWAPSSKTATSCDQPHGTMPPLLFPTRCSVSSPLAGPLPWEWCNGSWWQFDVQNNAGLCSEVPRCLRERILSFAGTSLIDSINNQDQGIGEGVCWFVQGRAWAVLQVHMTKLGLWLPLLATLPIPPTPFICLPLILHFPVYPSPHPLHLLATDPALPCPPSPRSSCPPLTLPPIQPTRPGGYCNVDPPTCQPEQGCRILRPDPLFFTNATSLSFAFTTFSSLSNSERAAGWVGPSFGVDRGSPACVGSPRRAGCRTATRPPQPVTPTICCGAH